MARTRVQIEVLSDGISALMKEAGIVAEVDKAAERIAGIAGDEFSAKPAQVVGDRPMALVVPDGDEGRYLEATEKTLSKAVTACRS